MFSVMVLFITVFDEIPIGLYDGLDSVLEALAGLCHSVPGEGHHHLHDLCHEKGDSVVGGLVNIPFTNAPHEIVTRIAVWASRRPYLLQPEPLGSLPRTSLRLLWVVGIMYDLYWMSLLTFLCTVVLLTFSSLAIDCIDLLGLASMRLSRAPMMSSSMASLLLLSFFAFQ